MSANPHSYYLEKLKNLLIEIQGNWYREDRFFKMGLERFSLGSDSNSYESIKIKFFPAFERWQELRILKSRNKDSVEDMWGRIHLIQFKDISNHKIIRSISNDKANQILKILEQIKISSEPESLGIEIIVDNSSLSRKPYSTPSGFWDRLSGYGKSVHDFYDVLHGKLIEQLKEKILENDLRNIVIFDVGCGTGRLIMKLFDELTSDPRLHGRVSKIMGIDFSEENIRALGEFYASLSSEVLKEDSELTGRHLWTYADKVKEKLRLSQSLTSAHMSAADLGSLEIEKDQTLICLTSGGLTRHVMPFQIALQAFEAMAQKNCRFFLGCGLENVWINRRIAKSLGFQFSQGPEFSIPFIPEISLVKRITVLDGVGLRARSELEEKAKRERDESSPDFRRVEAHEEAGFIAAAFSSNLLGRMFNPSEEMSTVAASGAAASGSEDKPSGELPDYGA